MPDSAEPTPNKPAVRDNAGRFLPGNTLSVGHRAPQQLLAIQFRKVFNETVGTEKFKEIVARHIDLILTAPPKEAGPLIELLYSYVMGKPTQNINLDVSAETKPTLPVNLTPQQVAVLEEIRGQMAGPVIDAEVIDRTPEVSS